MDTSFLGRDNVRGEEIPGGGNGACEGMGASENSSTCLVWQVPGEEQVMRMNWGWPQFIKGLVWLRCLHMILGMRENKTFKLGSVMNRSIFGMMGW